MARTEPSVYLASVLSAWGLAGADLAPSTSGLNNRSWFVDHPRGRFVLRIHSQASRDEVESEHALLLLLDPAELPFATPTPIPARDGSTCPLVDTPTGPRVAALFVRITGSHLDDEDVGGIETAAAAFARLDLALSTLDADRPPFDPHLDRVHRLVPDLRQLDELGPEAADLVRRMAGAPTELRATLRPRQLIHDDFAFGNVLMNGGRVVGILDFEFAVHEPRAAELAIALRLALSKSTRDRIWEPLLRGYLSVLPLTTAEIEALPTLALHHETVALVWWLGRYRAGISDARSLDDHITRALALEPWLSAHGREVVAAAHQLSARTR